MTPEAAAMADAWRVGTSGWSYQHWRGLFYPAELPASRWFEHYTGYFSTVELNNTFYRLPSAETFAGWARRAPPGFLYALKANRFITHIKRLRELDEPVERFLQRARLLGDHLGPVLYQLPPRFPCDPGRLEHFLQVLPGDLTHVFEFRDQSWMNDDVYALIERYGAGLCIADMPGQECTIRATCATVYVRFHGNQVLYGDSYPREELALWAARLSYFAAEGRSVYAYFNNDVGACAVANALELTGLMRDLGPGSGIRDPCAAHP
jgi:uncharacterized protein YecE (DUF72 family)